MKKYLVIGNPIGHSLSPKLHNHWIKKNNIDAVYDKKQLNENDIEENSSIIVQERSFYNSSNSSLENLSPDFHQVSQIYEISSANMHIIDDVDIEIKIPESYLDFDYWKFRIYSLDGDLLVEDITTWSKEGIVYGIFNNHFFIF